MKQPLNDDLTISTVELVERDLTQPDRMQWWYRIAAPPRPASTESFTTREAYRRGKLISIALLMQLTIVIILLPTLGIFVNHALIPNLSIMVVLLGIAIFLNRKGWVIPAGILAVAGLDLSLMLDLLSYPALSSFLLPLLDLLVLPELFAVSLLPPRAVFIDAGLHICFIIAALTFLIPQDAETKILLHTSALQDAIARPIVLQILVAVITYLWVRSATQAIERADRATSIAMLERDMAEQGVRVTEEKQQLEDSIQQIVSVHAQAANGNYGARVSLTEGNPLWTIAGSLNNLLSRVQRYRQDSLLLTQTNEAIHRFFQARSHVGNGFISWHKTNTPVDVLVQQHNGLMESSPISLQTESNRPL